MTDVTVFADNSEKEILQDILTGSAECLFDLVQKVQAQEELTSHEIEDTNDDSADLSLLNSDQNLLQVDKCSDKFTCEYCGVSYALRHVLKWHQTKYHKQETRTKGESRDKNTAAAANGSKSEENNDITNKPGTILLACKFCDTTHSTTGSLYMHCMRNHRKDYKASEEKKIVKRDVSFDERKPSVYYTKLSDASKTGDKTVGHSNAKQGSEQFTCEFCGMSYSIYGSLRSHLFRKHNQAWNTTRNTENPSADTSLDETAAADSNDTFDYESETEEFVIDNNSSGSEQFFCEFCDKVYSRAGSLNMHCRRKHTQAYLGSRNSPSGGSPNRSIRCQYCPMKVGSASGLSSHMKSKHPNMLDQSTEGNSSQKTIQTSRSTPGSARLKERAARVKQSPEKRKSVNNNSLKCDKCDREFATAEFLCKHKLTHSNAKTSLTCYHCGELFKQFGLLKQHLEAKECGSENDEPSAFSSMEERPVQLSRKRKYENKENNKENRTLTQILGDLSTPSAKKIKTEPDIVILEPQLAVDELFEVKLEAETRYEVSPANRRPNLIEAQNYNDNQENRPVSVAETLFTPPMPPRTTSFTARGELNDSTNNQKTNTKIIQSETNASDSYVIVNQESGNSGFNVQSPLPPIHSSPSVGSDFSSISQHQILTSTSILENAVADSLIEKSPLPLSTGIFTRTAQFPNELMIVWSYSLEEDLLAAVSMNKKNSILCVQELETLNLPKLQKDFLSQSKMVTFNMLDSNDTFTPWTVIYFGEKNCPTGLKKKLFRSFVDVEKTLLEHAASRGMDINNVMRYSEDGLFPLISKNLNQKCMAFNCIE